VVDKKAILDEFKVKRKKISELRTQLNQINEEKESFYEKQLNAGKEIKSLITEIKVLKKKRDDLTATVKESKAKKEKIVNEIKKKISEITTIKKDKLAGGTKGNPVHLKRQIEDMETKIETEALSFDKEQKLMKKINELKNKFGEYGEVAKVLNSINAMSKEIDELKKKEKEFKKIVRKNARESQNEHEKMIELSKKVDELKVVESENYNKFIVQKKEFSVINRKLKDMLSTFSKLKEGLDDIRIKKKKEKVEKDKLTIEDKKSKVNEKLKKGEKLTTEDLLIFQR